MFLLISYYCKVFNDIIYWNLFAICDYHSILQKNITYYCYFCNIKTFLWFNDEIWNCFRIILLFIKLLRFYEFTELISVRLSSKIKLWYICWYILFQLSHNNVFWFDIKNRAKFILFISNNSWNFHAILIF